MKDYGSGDLQSSTGGASAFFLRAAMLKALCSGSPAFAPQERALASDEPWSAGIVLVLFLR